jgi:hypothetical protein
LFADDLGMLEREWFVPLFHMLKGGSLRHLDIHLGGLGDFSLSTGGMRRFWRLGRPIGAAT